MAEVLLDSDVIIAWLRGSDPIARLVPDLLEQGEVLIWTAVSVAEIFAGVRRGEEKRAENLFLTLEIVAVSPEVGRKAGRYLPSYARSHGVGLGDALIAAAAHCHQIPLWTLNRKHYPMSDIDFFTPPS